MTKAARADQKRPGFPASPAMVYTTRTVITPTGMRTARKSMNGLPLRYRVSANGRARSRNVTMPAGMITAAAMPRVTPSGSPRVLIYFICQVRRSSICGAQNRSNSTPK